MWYDVIDSKVVSGFIEKKAVNKQSNFDHNNDGDINNFSEKLSETPYFIKIGVALPNYDINLIKEKFDFINLDKVINYNWPINISVYADSNYTCNGKFHIDNGVYINIMSTT